MEQDFNNNQPQADDNINKVQTNYQNEYIQGKQEIQIQESDSKKEKEIVQDKMQICDQQPLEMNEENKKEEECKTVKLRLQMIPQMDYYPLPKVNPFSVKIAQKETVQDLHFLVAEALLQKNQLSHLNAKKLVQWSRIWKIEGSKDNLIGIKNSLYATKGDQDLLPIEINGQILDYSLTIQQLQLREDEILLYEIKISTDIQCKCQFPFIPAETQESEIKKKEQQLLQAIEIEKEIQKRMNTDIINLMGRNSSGGLCGLQNLGNTCFMNSVLQCMVNTEPLTKYFLNDIHHFHINPKNIYGTKGRLAMSFGGLVQNIFVGNNKHLAPWEIKKIVAMKANQFAGFAQHDSQEMLTVLLETLHEDINAVSKKPYVEYSDKPDRTDEEISKEFWNGFQKREQSIFVDLFYGQLKSRVQCTKCDHVSLTFDPFNVLSLPIPFQKSQNFTIKFVPHHVLNQAIEFQMIVGEYVTVNEIKQKIVDFLLEVVLKGQKPDDEWIEPFLATTTHKQSIDVIDDEKFLATQGLEKQGIEIIAYQKEPFSLLDLQKGDEASDFKICEIRMVQQRKSYMLFSSIQQIGYSRLHLFKKSWTAKQIRLRIFHIVKPLVQYLQQSHSSKNQKLTLEQEYDMIFLNSDGTYNPDNELYDLEIHNNMPTHSSYMITATPICDFCQQKHKDNCSFAFQDNTTFEEIYLLMTSQRELELTVNWKYNAKVNFKPIENPNFLKISLNIPRRTKENPSDGLPKFSKQKKSQNLSIYDCLSGFGQEETLSGGEKWYCSKCKDHVVALKKIQIYRTPEFLIVHLKRFSHQNNSMFGSRKLNMQIDFPVKGLNMTPFLVENQNHIEQKNVDDNENKNDDQIEEIKKEITKKNFTYDLYAISNHYGSLNGGHYTAYCQNPIAKKWYEFDDASVSKISDTNSLEEIENAIVSKAAYVLFYRLRK